ncbi:hypothetical protein CEQ90_15800 [Lewinellaceae bacterium SD302]|nr:hypothetical protein CEQ90_15800 [Lewinellaceae bacterium SD302]
MNKKNILIAILLLAAVGGGVAYYLYQQKTPDAASYRTDHRLKATELFAAYEANEEKANEKFLGKTLEVNGTVREVATNAETGTLTVHLEAGGLLGGVSCEMAPGSRAEIVPGQAYTLKGICSGMLMDVVLNRCVVL